MENKTRYHIALTDRGIVLANLPEAPIAPHGSLLWERYYEAKREAIQQALATAPAFKNQELGLKILYSVKSIERARLYPEENKFYPVDLSGWEVTYTLKCKDGEFKKDCQKCSDIKCRLVVLTKREYKPVVKMLYPCDCKDYNGGQCYNCLNGFHEGCQKGCNKKHPAPTEGDTKKPTEQPVTTMTTPISE